MAVVYKRIERFKVGRDFAGRQTSTGIRMRARMLAALIARVVVHRSWRRLSCARPIVTHIDPDAAGGGYALHEIWHRRVVAVQSLGREHELFEPAQPAAT